MQRTLQRFALAASLAALSGSAFAQAADTPYQSQFSNDAKKTSITISNSGASSIVPAPPNGTICANLYVFAADGPMIACCAVAVPPNGLTNLSLKRDVLDVKHGPNTVALRAMSTTAPMGACNAATVGTESNVLAMGLLIWRDGQPFTPSTLSASQLNVSNAECLALEPTPRICGQ